MSSSLGFSHTALVISRLLAATVCVTAVGYYTFAVYCARDFFFRTARRSPRFSPPISILKPVCGLDRDAYENFASFCRQQYPAYQILFGAQREDDPGIAVARQVARDFPHVDIRFVVGKALPAANPKVGCLASMTPEAKYSTLLISDSDIRVGPEHLSYLAHALADPRVGVVTCLYRSRGRGFGGQMDALGLSTEFQPSVLVARKIEGISFGMGSGILIRGSILAAVGGFEAIADFLADDYHLGNLPFKAGHGVELSECVVEQTLGTSSLRGLVEHQMRWNRGIRAARPAGYAGLLLTQGFPASLLLLLLTGGSPASWAACGLTLASRLGMAWFVAVRCLRDRTAGRSLWLVPLRDLLSCALWLAAFFGTSVNWRGNRYRLEAGGRLASEGAQDHGQDAALVGTRAVS